MSGVVRLLRAGRQGIRKAGKDKEAVSRARVQIVWLEEQITNKRIMKIKKRKFRTAVFLTILSVLLQTVPVRATEEDEQLPTGPDWAIDMDTAPEVVSESAILMDADTGVILYEKNIHEKMYPASVTKLLTCLVASEHSELTDVVTFSHDAVFGIERGSSNIGIDEGEELTMEECYYAALLESANEVSSGIAEHVGGSIEGFAAMMNAKVQELGGSDSNFVNANGLHNDEHYTSAYDMALVGRAFVQNEVLLEMSGTPFYHIAATPAQKDEIDLRHHHGMLPGGQRGQSWIYEYTIGGKNGFTVTSRQTLVTFAEKDGHRLVCVVMKVEKPDHYRDSTHLFDYGFACYEDPSIRALIDAKAEELNPVQEEETPQTEEQSGGLTAGEMENGAGSLDDEGETNPEEADGQEEESREPEQKKSGGIPVLTIIVIAVVLTAVAVCVLIIYRSYRREQERRRRQAEIMARHRARKLQQAE